MAHEKIENALLTTGVADFDTDGIGKIELTRSGKKLAKTVIDCLRSSTVEDLSKSEEFFNELEAAFCESRDNTKPESEEIKDEIEAAEEPDTRTWRLKKIKTQGFGGLNAVSGDVFEFDVACNDFCIEGQNGSGKSSLANAILFAMTGKIHRDQRGVLDNPAHLEPVMSDEGKKLGHWPPIATYPDSWGVGHLTVHVEVVLTFGNGTDNEEIVALRRLHGKPEALEQDVFIDPRLTAEPALIEAGLLMPMRIQHICVPESDDNSQLVGLIRQLIGLEPLLGIADLTDKLSHGNHRFLKFAQNNDVSGKFERIFNALNAARERIRDLDINGIDLEVEIETRKLVCDDQLKKLAEAKNGLDHLQADGFQELATMAFNGFNPGNSQHRRRVTDVINQLHVDARRQNESQNLPPVLNGITFLANRTGDKKFEALKLALQKAETDLKDAIMWANRQNEDVLFRLKAVAAEHFEDCPDPQCPLCRQSIGAPEHHDLIKELRILRIDAEKAQTRLADACRCVEQCVIDAAQHVVPNNLLRVNRFAVKRDIQNQVLGTFVEAAHVCESLPGFARIARSAVDAAFGAVEEVEFGSVLPEQVNGNDLERVRRLLDHLANTVAAAENWQYSRQAFRDAWARLFLRGDEHSLTTRILQLNETIGRLEPFRLASENVGGALEIVKDYNKIVERQVLREKIIHELKPLRKLRKLVNSIARRTIDDVSDVAKTIHGQIYNPELLTYERAELSEARGKQSLTFRAKLGNDVDWWIDASLLANTSWMRGVLWSFVFAIREQAIIRSKHCPFELMVLDDPQMTFDTRNLKGWSGFLGRPDELKQRQSCQLLVTTHSMPFALEMTPMLGIEKAEIETGQPWSKPAQVVKGDFAAVRFEKMVAENSDELARSLIAHIRVLAETLLKHAIERFEPAFVHKPEATLGHMINCITNWKNAQKLPYTDRVFRSLVSAKSSNSDLFAQLSEPHHSISETITVREAQRVYQFWKETLFPAVHRVWEEYRFLQRTVVGEVAPIQLPTNCNHTPPRSAALAAVRPLVRGRVSAYSDGRAASAISIQPLADAEQLNLSALAAYRLDKDTLSPVARIGDILLTRMDAKCRASNLVIEDRGAYRIARRWHENAATPTLAVLAASSSNPREVRDAVISRTKGANRRKIVGVLFAAERLQPGDRVDPDAEVTDLDANNQMVADLVDNTDVFEVQGSSAEPIALDKQYLLAKTATTNFSKTLNELDGRPVIAEDSEGCAYFKRLRLETPGLIILESLDKSGSEGLVVLAVDSKGPGLVLAQIREVVGVVFDKL